MRYQIGDFIRYQTWEGGARLVRVDWKYDNIKNGKPGFDGAECNMDFTINQSAPPVVWGYDSQITGVFPANHARVNKS